jgi:hypothetical protein
MNRSNEIDVIYLSYVPYGLEHLRNFLISYVKYDSGVAHQVNILFNGFNNEEELKPFKTILQESGIDHKVITTLELFDIGAYRDCAKQLNSKYVMFLNTYSEILAHDWLRIMYQSITKDNVGAVGCTGCWGSFAQIKPSPMTIYGLKILLNFNFRYFPHLRTNAFMIERQMFLSLEYDEIRPRFIIKFVRGFRESKLKTFHFEHGKNSMTNQLIGKKLKILVCGRNGKTYTTQEWKTSRTYRYGEQENLVISDNQTMVYQKANDFDRSYLRFCSWNEPIDNH